MLHLSSSSMVAAAFRWRVLGAFLAAWLIPALPAAERISFIERFQDKQVTIHFDTKANRKYELQALRTLTCPPNDPGSCNKSGVPTDLWTTIFVAPKVPFPSHYVVPDYRTNRSRFYRLKITQ